MAANREEVGGVRQARDPIEYVKRLLTELQLASAEELKQTEKDIRARVQDSLARAKDGHFPPDEWLYHEIYADPAGKDEPQGFVRMPDYHRSVGLVL